MNIKDEVKRNKVVIGILPEEGYNDKLVKTIKKFGGKNKVCYITLNKGYDALIILFKKNKINTDNFFFIDAITKTVKMEKNKVNCIFTSSPNALTELSITILDVVEKQKSDFIILDSLSTLLIYHSDNIVAKFARGLITEFELTNSKIMFTLTTKDKRSSLFKNMQMFVNKVIDL